VQEEEESWRWGDFCEADRASEVTTLRRYTNLFIIINWELILETRRCISKERAVDGEGVRARVTRDEERVLRGG